MAPFYLGSNTLKAYIGSTTVQKIYKGTSLVFQNQVVTPSISFISKTDSTLTFTVTNNDSATATIYYEHSDATPDLASVSVAAGATSANLTITGLSSGTSYTVYAQATRAGAESSSVVSFTQSTQSWTQLGGQYDKSSTSPLRGTYNGSTWFMPTFNNSSVYATKWKFVATADSGAWSNEYWTRLEVAAYDGTNYTDSSIISYSGYIVSYINAPGNAFANNSNTAASVSGGNHNGSTIFVTLPTAKRLNKIWIRTGYTKISGMTLYYLS